MLARVSSQAMPGYGAASMVSRRNPISRTRAPEKRKRSWLEIESGGALVQSRINTYLILSYVGRRSSMRRVSLPRSKETRPDSHRNPYGIAG